MFFDSSNKPKGFKRIFLAAKNSGRAFSWLLSNESAFRQECFLLVVATMVLSYWDISRYEKMFLLVSVFFVMFAEIINTAIEAIIDRVGVEIHPLSGLAKDLGSAAVMLSVIIALFVWLSVIFMHL